MHFGVRNENIKLRNTADEPCGLSSRSIPLDLSIKCTLAAIPPRPSTTQDEPVTSAVHKLLLVRMPDLIRHPEPLEKTGFRLLPE